MGESARFRAWWLARPGCSHQRHGITHNETVQHVGLVLPPDAKGHLSIKLDNGYNVSYPAEDVRLNPSRERTPPLPLNWTPPRPMKPSRACG